MTSTLPDGSESATRDAEVSEDGRRSLLYPPAELVVAIVLSGVLGVWLPSESLLSVLPTMAYCSVLGLFASCSRPWGSLPPRFARKPGQYVVLLGIVSIPAVHHAWLVALHGLGTDPDADIMPSSFWDVFAVVVVADLLGPVVEEAFFRGYWLVVVSRCFSINTGCIITSVAFGLLHAPDLGFMVWMTVLGFLLAWIRIASGSLIPCVISHCLMNLGVTARQLFF
ncbi:MAG TPA: type II CAAX endopeptidase family protein [Acidimicrobiia bacterium]|nr:type II CAAX endopeptidase family protein [Acidimicrobiia bacterium]